VTDQCGSVKLTFGDADSQQTSPASKRLRLVTDSIDHLADFREQPSKSSSIPSAEDRPPQKFRLLFGGSSEEVSQPLSPRDEGRGDVVDNADSDVTPQSKSSSDSDSLQSDDARGKDEEVMTQADEEAMKTYVPLNAGALSYISDEDGDGNVLDFFLKPLDSRPGTTNCRMVQRALDMVKEGQSQPSILNAATAGTNDDDAGSKRARSSTILRTLSVSDSRHNDTAKELIDSMLLHHSAVGDEVNVDDRQLTSTVATRVADEVTVPREDVVCNLNGDSLLASTTALTSALATDIRTTVAEGSQVTSAVGLAMCSAQSYSQGSDDFRTPASQSSTQHSIVVVDCDVTSRSAGSQPLDSDSTIDVGCSPVKNQLRTATAAGTSPTYFASDATTTDGWCTPCKSSLPQSPCHQLTSIRSPTSRLNQISGDRSVDSPPSSCSKLTDIKSSTGISGAHCMLFPSSVGPRSPSLMNFVDVRTSTARTQLSSSPASVQLVQLCRDASSTTSSTTSSTSRDARPAAGDNYDGDVDSDCDDVISLCVRRRRTIRHRSRSTSGDAIVVSSDDSDQSPPLRTSRVCGKDDVTVMSSSSDTDYSAHPGGGDADSQRSFTTTAADVERSPVLFSEPLV